MSTFEPENASSLPSSSNAGSNGTVIPPINGGNGPDGPSDGNPSSPGDRFSFTVDPSVRVSVAVDPGKQVRLLVLDDCRLNIHVRLQDRQRSRRKTEAAEPGRYVIDTPTEIKLADAKAGQQILLDIQIGCTVRVTALGG